MPSNILRSPNGSPISSPVTNGEFRYFSRQLPMYLMLILIFILPLRGWFTVSERVTIAVPFGAIVGLVWIISVALNPKIQLPDAFHLVLGILVFWMGITSLWAIDPSQSVIQTARFGLYLLIGLAIWDLFQTSRAIEYALIAYVLGAGLTMSVELTYFIMLDLERVSTFSNPNYLSGRLLFALPFAWYFVFKQSDRTFNSYRIICIAFIGLLVPTIVWTQSRQGLIAMLVGFVILLLFTIRLRKYLLVVPPILIGVVLYARTSMGDRFNEISIILNEIYTVVQGGTVADPTTARVAVIDGTMELLYVNPITGYGVGNFRPAFIAMHDVPWTAHNSYLGMAVETGLGGLILFLTLFAILLQRIASHPNKAIILGFMSIWVVLSLTNDWHTGFATWGSLFILLCTSRIPLDDPN